jgi:hypothetical protein
MGAAVEGGDEVGAVMESRMKLMLALDGAGVSASWGGVQAGFPIWGGQAVKSGCSSRSVQVGVL